jgi:hypothetical protein
MSKRIPFYLLLLLSFAACKSDNPAPQRNVEIRITGTNVRPEWGGRVMLSTVTPLSSNSPYLNVRSELITDIPRDTAFTYRFPNRNWGNTDQVQFSLEMDHIVRGGTMQLPSNALLKGEIIIDGVVKSTGVLNSSTPFPIANPNGGLYMYLREPVGN